MTTLGMIWRRLTRISIGVAMAAAMSGAGAASVYTTHVFDTSAPVSASQWHNVGAPGEPPYFTATDPQCAQPSWQDPNGGAPNTGAGFLRDKLGFVHLRGAVQNGSSTGLGFHVCPIFYLPPGNLPEFNTFATQIYSNATGRFLGYLLVRPSGAGGAGTVAGLGGDVELYDFTGPSGPGGIVALDGITFRCFPSGMDGCP